MGKLFGVDDIIIIAAFAYFGGVQANFMKNANNGGNPFNPGDWNWKSPGTYIGIASGALFGYSQTLQHCEYLIDVNTGEKLLNSHLGDGKINFMRYGEWVDNHSAFKLINSVVEDVPFGGVNNIRNMTGAAFMASGLMNIANTINEFNPAAQLMDVIAYGFTGKDRFGNSMSLGQGMLKAATVIPIGKVGSAVGQEGKLTYELIHRSKLGADGGISRHVIEKLDGLTISKTHQVFLEGKIIHQHQLHIGTYGTTRYFPEEWLNFPTIK